MTLARWRRWNKDTDEVGGRGERTRHRGAWRSPGAARGKPLRARGWTPRPWPAGCLVRHCPRAVKFSVAWLHDGRWRGGGPADVPVHRVVRVSFHLPRPHTITTSLPIWRSMIFFQPLSPSYMLSSGLASFARHGVREQGRADHTVAGGGGWTPRRYRSFSSRCRDLVLHPGRAHYGATADSRCTQAGII